MPPPHKIPGGSVAILFHSCIFIITVTEQLALYVLYRIYISYRFMENVQYSNFKEHHLENVISVYPPHSTFLRRDRPAMSNPSILYFGFRGPKKRADHALPLRKSKSASMDGQSQAELSKNSRREAGNLAGRHVWQQVIEQALISQQGRQMLQSLLP